MSSWAKQKSNLQLGLLAVINDVVIKPLNIISVPGGDVLHALKATDPEYRGFGEAYFSSLESGAVKAWKRHRKMQLNLVVPTGRIRFVLCDDRDTVGLPKFQEVILSTENYARLTVPPMIWVGFQGLSEGLSMLLNVADIAHSPREVDRKPLHEIDYRWQDVT